MTADSLKSGRPAAPPVSHILPHSATLANCRRTDTQATPADHTTINTVERSISASHSSLCDKLLSTQMPLDRYGGSSTEGDITLRSAPSPRMQHVHLNSGAQISSHEAHFSPPNQPAASSISSKYEHAPNTPPEGASRASPKPTASQPITLDAHLHHASKEGPTSYAFQHRLPLGSIPMTLPDAPLINTGMIPQMVVSPVLMAKMGLGSVTDADDVGRIVQTGRSRPTSDFLDFSAGGAADLIENDQMLPMANIGRIMKRVLPDNAKIAKDAKECLQQCVYEFVQFVIGEASDKCINERRKTLNGDDILWAFEALGFDRYLEPMRQYLLKWRSLLAAFNPAPRERPCHDTKSSSTSGSNSDIVSPAEITTGAGPPTSHEWGLAREDGIQYQAPPGNAHFSCGPSGCVTPDTHQSENVNYDTGQETETGSRSGPPLLDDSCYQEEPPAKQRRLV